jgi:hypothetical protein
MIAEDPASAPRSPRVSVLMPTFRQAAFIRRALESLRAQSFADWELIVVDDGSPDETAGIVAPYLADPRVRYHRLGRNRGLGAALNVATGLARGRYLAYLPSDDLYYPDHLARLVATIEARPGIGLAYGGLRWDGTRVGPTLQGAGAIGCEAEALANPPPFDQRAPLTGGNLFALVQVLHRRDWPGVRWAEREEVVSDRLEADFWRSLLGVGARPAYVGAITCEWVWHDDGRTRIVAGPAGGLARYRAHYGVGRGEWLNWQPTRGVQANERARWGRFDRHRALPEPGGLKILLAGELGFNPERVLAFEEAGHALSGLWIARPEPWDAAGPFPWGNIVDIPLDRQWADRVRAFAPDVIYALLNWQALPVIEAILDARLGIPLVFHFKEGPFICLEKGLWPLLTRVLRESDGQIFINDEMAAWFALATDGVLDPETAFILDGDLPKVDWFGEGWAPKLSAADGQIHTVCPGRPLGLDPFEAIAAAGIHVHFYGDHFHRQHPNWARAGLATGHMHLHPTVEPEGWVRELSRYDAAWCHLFDSDSGGDLRRATWDDLNLPARLGTFAAAGLPWIMRDNRDAVVATESLARRYDIGLFLRDYPDLAAQLRDRPRLAALTANMRAARRQFAFDTHVDALVAFFRRVIERRHGDHRGV